MPAFGKASTLIPSKKFDINMQLLEVTPDTDRWYVLKSEIENTDKIIDQRVNELYDLTSVDIRIVEGK
jgi:hypothetical protein